jgi:hypothetical protein
MGFGRQPGPTGFLLWGAAFHSVTGALTGDYLDALSARRFFRRGSRGDFSRGVLGDWLAEESRGWGHPDSMSIRLRETGHLLQIHHRHEKATRGERVWAGGWGSWAWGLESSPQPSPTWPWNLGGLQKGCGTWEKGTHIPSNTWKRAADRAGCLLL